MRFVTFHSLHDIISVAKMAAFNAEHLPFNDHNDVIQYLLVQDGGCEHVSWHLTALTMSHLLPRWRLCMHFIA
jgi:hypothetical protein